jgi:hypothetical protein
MSYAATVYKVMIASPGDVNEERRIIREVIAHWNSAHSETRSIVLMPIGWESHSVPDMGGRPQGKINKQVLEGCDLLVGVFWTRIGTQTGEYDSGTIEEIEGHIKAGKPAMLYFSKSPVSLDSVDQEQYRKLVEFKESCRPRGLYQEYGSIDEFRNLLSQHIQTKMNDPEYLAHGLNYETMGIEVPIELAVPSLSKEACELLKEASQDQYGSIIRFNDSEGFNLQTNGLALAESDNPREKANWEAALNDLINKGLIRDEGYKGECFVLTKKGYEVADSL